jgi:methionyl-tRNA formyltransferase
MGTPDFAVGTLEAILAAGHEVVGVVTQQDKPVGRKQELKPTAVKACALEHGLAVYQPAKVRNNPEFYETLKSLAPDVIVVAAYGQIIPKEVLELPKYGCMNVHASLLPKYRGAAPIQWAVIDGEEKSGVTIMQMNEGLDTGDMIAKTELTLAADETGGSLFDRLAKAGAELLVETLVKAEAGELHPEPQPAESTTAYARMITKADGRIDWTKDAVQIERQIRGLNPWPSAYSSLNGKGLKIWRAEVVDGDGSPAAGTVVSSGTDGLDVQTGSGILRIKELQLEGRKRMAAGDFLRGRDIPAGTVLGE